MAYRYGASVRKDLELAMDASRTLAHTFEGSKQSGKNTDRKVMDSILRQVLEKNRSFLAVWAQFEPDSLDGRDKEFINTPGHDATGQYVPYWYRKNGTIALEPVADYAQCDYPPVESIMEPYLYPVGGKDVLMTSVMVPIKSEGKVAGFVGVDFPLALFGELINKIKPYETGYAFLVSNSGIMVAHPDSEAVGKDAVQRQPQEIQQAFKDSVLKGKEYTFYRKSIMGGTDNYFVVTPISIGDATTPWSFAISIPTDKIQEQSRKLTWSIISISVVALLMFGVVITLISNSIVRPMRQVVDGLKDIAQGEGYLTRRLNIKSSDEVGELARWFDTFMEKLQNLVRDIASNSDDVKSSATELAGLSELLDKSSAEVSQNADSVAAAAEEMNSNMNAVAAAMEEASTNVSIVVSST